MTERTDVSHRRRYPGESDDYRAARDELLEAEVALRAQVEQVAALRRALPTGGALVRDYAFEEVSVDDDAVKTVRLSELFEAGKQDSLIVYSFMYGPEWEKACPSCTCIADTYNGYSHHVHARTNFVVVAKAPVAKLRALAKARGWRNVRLLSSLGNDYNVDYLAQPEGQPEKQHPMLNVFRKTDAGISHFWGSELLFVDSPGHPRHVDMIWPLWNLLDMTPEGRGDFLPQLSYDG